MQRPRHGSEAELTARAAAVGGALAVAACSPVTAAIDARDTGAYDASVDDGSDDVPSIELRDASAMGAVAVPPLDAGDPPQVTCDTDAEAGGDPCAPPHSVCADTRWLVYYVGGFCAAGVCRWEKKFLDCGACANGACAGGLHTAPAK